MRDFRDAKAMAHTLRDALKAKAVETTHSESLELVAKVFLEEYVPEVARGTPLTSTGRFEEGWGARG